MADDRPQVKLHIDGPVARLILSHPARRNAITGSMWAELTETCRMLAGRNDLRAALVRGEGEAAFASGADIGEFGENRRCADQAAAYHDAVQGALEAIRAIPFPVVAQVQGFCVGAGTAIALACDLRYLDDRARFGIPAAKLSIGYSPEWIGDLVRIVGHGAAADMLMTGELFGADKALRWGFANEVLPAAELADFVEAKLATLAANAPLTLAAAKVALGEIAAFDGERDWEAARRAAEACAESRDYQHALQAFADKRTPEFKGE